ncbi:MAG: hypothetical protein IKU84_05075 [Clostridia bacterium]|nr:hypothetical protein [Clostridia bacterium]
MLNEFIVLTFILFFGAVYYTLSMSELKYKKKNSFSVALLIKVFMLVASFALAFFKQEYITIGNVFTFGGRSAIMTLIMIEIVDALVDRKREK